MADGANGPAQAEMGLNQKDLGIDSPSDNRPQTFDRAGFSSFSRVVQIANSFF